MSKGFLTIAQNGFNADYVKLAYNLAMSLKCSQKKYNNISIVINEGEKVRNKVKSYFDKILYAEDPKTKWKVDNKWQYFELSPYDETIVLDADMLFFNDITHWWDCLESSDLEFTTVTKNYRGNTITSDYYRKTFTANKLPNLHTALFYFKKTKEVETYFKLVEIIFKNWEEFFNKFLKSPPKFLSGDVAYALAAKIMFNREWHNDFLTFTHMRGRLQDDDIVTAWNKELPFFFTDYHGRVELKVNNFNQTYPFHYIQKDFLNEGVIDFYEEKVRLL